MTHDYYSIAYLQRNEKASRSLILCTYSFMLLTNELVDEIYCIKLPVQVVITTRAMAT